MGLFQKTVPQDIMKGERSNSMDSQMGVYFCSIIIVCSGFTLGKTKGRWSSFFSFPDIVWDVQK